MKDIIFISQEMSKRSKEYVYGRREKILKKFLEKHPEITDYEVIDQYVLPENIDPNNKLAIIGRDISLMGTADYIVIDQDADSRGCKSERFILDKYDIEYYIVKIDE